MKITFLRNYRKSGSTNPVFVYTVSGTEKDLQAYKDTQGDNYREDNDLQKPLWFTTRFVGDNGKLMITTNGKTVADMSEFDKAASLASQYGGNFGQALATAAVSNILRTSTPQPLQQPVEPSGNDLDKM